MVNGLYEIGAGDFNEWGTGELLQFPTYPTGDGSNITASWSAKTGLLR